MSETVKVRLTGNRWGKLSNTARRNVIVDAVDHGHVWEGGYHEGRYVGVIQKNENDGYGGTLVTEDDQPEDDGVNHPAHYNADPSGVECITVVRHRNFNIGNAIKYLWRSGLKSNAAQTDRETQIQDLEKARFYINDEIVRLKGENA